MSGCEIGGVYYATNAPNPNDPCQSCQPGTSASVWNNLADGTACGNGQVCASGQCGTQCDISGTVYTTGSANPMNACQTCQPGTSTTTWTNLANGTSCPGPGTCSAGSCVMSCAGGSTLTWQQSQAEWDFDVNTQGTYSCSATLPPGTTASGQSVPVTASGGTRIGNAIYTCNAGTWVPNSGSTCDGALINLPATTVVCTSPDPVATMFIGFYASDLCRCADTMGLAYWVDNYNGPTPACTASYTDPVAVACWENVIKSGAGSTYTQAQAEGHITQMQEQNFCGTVAGYPWSCSGSYVISTGTQCKYYP